MAIEIVDLPIKNSDFPWLCKRLPGRVVEVFCHQHHQQFEVAVGG